MSRKVVTVLLYIAQLMQALSGLHAANKIKSLSFSLKGLALLTWIASLQYFSATFNIGDSQSIQHQFPRFPACSKIWEKCAHEVYRSLLSL